MEKENLEIRKALEELTAEDLAKVNGGTTRGCLNCPYDRCPKNQVCHKNICCSE